MSYGKVKIVFIGGLTNGKIAYDYLSTNKYVELSLIITHEEDSKRPRYVRFEDNPRLVRDNSANKYINDIARIKPDFIFVVGWSELLSDQLIGIPKLGTIGFHPSRLPSDRGRSVLAWQIEEGYNESSLSMFFYNNIPDLGDIIAQEVIKISENDYINDVLDKIDFATKNILRAYFPLVRKGIAPRMVQELSQGNFRRLRNEGDSHINWQRNSIEIYNKIRAISKPYPGALADMEGNMIRIWKSEIISEFKYGSSSSPGTIVAKLFDGTFIVKTRDSFLRVLEYSNQNDE